jgi:hypothetical protein
MTDIKRFSCGAGYPVPTLLGPLQDNGGPSITHALLPGSVAIDVIPTDDCVDAEGAPLTTDQRGEPRRLQAISNPHRADAGQAEA